MQAGEQFAATDSTGYYEFPSLKPGATEVKVLQDSLGSSYTMAESQPMKVDVRPAQTTQIDLKATVASSLCVRVTRYEFADGNAVQTTGALKKAGGFEGAVVEITNGPRHLARGDRSHGHRLVQSPRERRMEASHREQ